MYPNRCPRSSSIVRPSPHSPGPDAVWQIVADQPSGTYVQVGMGSNMTVKVPFFPVISKQLRILGSFRYGMGDYPLAISLVERGLIDLKPLVTQVVEFDQALEAFETTRKGRDENGKVSHSVPNHHEELSC